MALRYHGNGVPLASLRAACGSEDDQAALVRSISLSNHLLDTGHAIEVLVIAGRVALVHPVVVPALYRLVRRDRALTDLTGLSQPARLALGLVEQTREVTVGDVRRHLGARAAPRHDPGYEALAELQRALLVDRGPFDMPARGVPYLSRDGYPYHLFHQAHGDLVKAAARISIPAATDRILATYLAAARFATPRRLLSLFKLFLTKEEVASSLERLAATGALRIEKIGRDTVAVAG
jgi:hypothetical protein